MQPRTTSCPRHRRRHLCPPWVLVRGPSAGASAVGPCRQHFIRINSGPALHQSRRKAESAEPAMPFEPVSHCSRSRPNQAAFVSPLPIDQKNPHSHWRRPIFPAIHGGGTKLYFMGQNNQRILFTLYLLFNYSRIFSFPNDFCGDAEEDLRVPAEL